MILIALAGTTACARTQPQPAVMALDAPPAFVPPASDAGVRAASVEAAAPPGDPETVTFSFRVLGQLYVRDPKGGGGGYRTSLELVARTDPPQRVAIGYVDEPGCRLAYDALELEEGADVAGGLVCYHAGFGDYIVVKREASGRFAVSSYGQSEALIGDENPPKIHKRTLGHVTIPARSRPVFELVDSDAGALLP